MAIIHVEKSVAMPDDLKQFITRCFRTGGNNRFQIADIFEWLPTRYPPEWYEYLTELEHEGETIWFQRQDYLSD